MLFRDVITEADGESIDFIRVGVLVALCFLLVLTAYDVICLKHGFDAMNFGTGSGGLILGGGAGGGLRAKGEKNVLQDLNQ